MVAVRRVCEVELLLLLFALAFKFVVVAFGMDVEDGLMVEVETMDLVEAYGKYGDNKSGNGLVFGFVEVGAGNGNVKVNGPSISICLLWKGVFEHGGCDGLVNSGTTFTAARATE